MTHEKKLPCDIVRDLLPLYHDGVVNEITGSAVQNHLADCPACQQAYDDLCADLPVAATPPSTGEKFQNMVRRQKRKQRWRAALIALLACAALVAFYFGQMQLPIVPVSDDQITLDRVYRYETEDGYRFFILFTAPSYDYSTGRFLTQQGADGTALSIRRTHPLISKKHAPKADTWVYDVGWETDDNNQKIYENITAVVNGDTVAWSAEKNADDPVPDYVYAYDQFLSGDGVVGWSTDLDLGYLQADYADGTTTRWDLEGNVLFQGTMSGDNEP